MIEVASVQMSLEAIANTVRPYDVDASNRLHGLSNALGGGPQATVWATTDIHTFIAPDTIVERFVAQRRASIFISIFTWIRNSLILAFIIVGWYGIFQAIEKYYDFLRAHPDQQSQSFLFLWQQGFGRTLPSFLTLSSIITIDVVVFTLIFLLTLWFRVENERRERDAKGLRSHLAHALAEASFALSARQKQLEVAGPDLGSETPKWALAIIQAMNVLNSTIQQMVVQLDKEIRQSVNVLGSTMQQMMVQLHQEMRILSDLAKQMSELPALSQSMATISEGMEKTATRLEYSNNALAQSVDSLIGPTKEWSEQQKDTLQAASRSAEFLQGIAMAQDQFVSKQGKLTTELMNALNMLAVAMEKAERLISDLGRVTAQQGLFIQELEYGRTAQDALAKVVSDTALTVGGTLSNLDASALSLQSIVTSMQDLVRLQTSLPDAMGDAIQSYSRTAESIARSCEALDASAIAIYQASQELKNVLSALKNV